MTGSVLFISVAGGWVHACLVPSDLRVPGLGNFEETLRALPPVSGGRFRFAVMGDPEERPEICCRLMERARAMGAAFVVIAGDVADRPTRPSFEAFNRKYRDLGPAGLPTFTAIGNHDISSLNLFEEYYGPPEFHFVYGDSLFIFADNNAPAARPRCAQYVREQITLNKDRVQHVFIIVHRPITDFRKLDGPVRNAREKGAYLYEILDTERVDAILAGHYHGYSREMYKETLLLVTGGAGGKLHDAGAFYHMVLMDVDPAGIKDTLVKAEKADEQSISSARAWIKEQYCDLFASRWRPLIPLLGACAFVSLGIRLKQKVTRHVIKEPAKGPQCSLS